MTTYGNPNKTQKNNHLVNISFIALPGLRNLQIITLTIIKKSSFKKQSLESLNPRPLSTNPLGEEPNFEGR
jgi:hypothetical protein